MSFKQLALRWLPTFLAFPLGGQIVVWLVGPVDTATKSAVAGLVVGAVLGALQWFALKPLGFSPLWILATALGLGVASPIAGLITEFQTTVTALTSWGFIAGLLGGLVQALSQKLTLGKVALWGLAVSATWGAAWFISANVIVDAEASYAIFGSTGALLATVILSVLINPVLAKSQA